MIFGCLLSRSPHGERGLKFGLIMIVNMVMAVALLTESVDWNADLYCVKLLLMSRSPHGERGLKFEFEKAIEYPDGVALLTESVDWNINSKSNIYVINRSLSSRRAWIEILNFCMTVPDLIVALLTESVDWNVDCTKYIRGCIKSLSSRRAWIEISTASPTFM